MVTRWSLAAAILTAMTIAGPAAQAHDSLIVMAGSVDAEVWAFAPVATVADAGHAVSWQNLDTVKHNVSPDATVSGLTPFPVRGPLTAAGTTWTCSGVPGGIRCTGQDGKPVVVPSGSYGFACSVHPDSMKGVLVIV